MSILIKKAVPVPKKKLGQEEYVWEKTDAGFRLPFPNNDSVELRQVDGKWEIRADLNGDIFCGIRPSLEIAFKVVDRMIWVKKRDIWSKIRPGVVLREFEGDLSRVETEDTFNPFSDSGLK